MRTINPEVVKAGLLTKINALYPQMTPAERTVADYVLSNDNIVNETVSHVVKSTGAGHGTVDRFCKRLGLEGFQDFKIRLAEDLTARRLSCVSESDNSFLSQLVEKARNDLVTTEQLLTPELITEAAKALARAGMVFIASAASSQGTAIGIDYRLARFGIPSICMADYHMQRYRATTLTPNDVAFVISFSGATRELLRVARLAKECGATLIGLTNYLESPLAEMADHVMVTGIRSDPLGAEIASKVAFEFVVTALFDRVAEERKEFRKVLLKTFQSAADSQM